MNALAWFGAVLFLLGPRPVSEEAYLCQDEGLEQAFRADVAEPPGPGAQSGLLISVYAASADLAPVGAPVGAVAADDTLAAAPVADSGVAPWCLNSDDPRCAPTDPDTGGSLLELRGAGLAALPLVLPVVDKGCAVPRHSLPVALGQARAGYVSQPQRPPSLG